MPCRAMYAPSPSRSVRHRKGSTKFAVPTCTAVAPAIMHEHPTQALLDAFTIRAHKGRLDGLKVAIVGDLLHSRVFRSNVILLKTMGADVWACGPATLIPPGLERLGARSTTSVDEAVEGADVVMLLRIQHERMQGHYIPSLREYFALFGMNTEPSIETSAIPRFARNDTHGEAADG